MPCRAAGSTSLQAWIECEAGQGSQKYRRHPEDLVKSGPLKRRTARQSGPPEDLVCQSVALTETERSIACCPGICVGA